MIHLNLKDDSEAQQTALKLRDRSEYLHFKMIKIYQESTILKIIEEKTTRYLKMFYLISR